MNIKKLIYIAFLFLTHNLFGETLGHIGDHAKILKGTLPNGLSYYIMDNKTAPGYADFTFIQKTSEPYTDSLSAENYSILKDMHNFRGGEFFKFLDNLGIGAENGFSIRRNYDNLVYCFSDIAVSRNSSVTDSLLLAILNLSSPKNCIQDKLSTEENIYRPDLQAIVIVGDVDTGTTAAKIHTLFQVVPRPTATVPTHIQPAEVDFDKNFIYVKNIETDCATLTIDHIFPPIDTAYITTAVPFIYEYFTDLTIEVIKSRLNKELASAGFFPIDSDVRIYPYIDRQKLRISLQCAPQEYLDAYKILLSLLEQITHFGITEEEFRRESDKVFFRTDDLYRRRKILSNDYFSKQCIENFTMGTPISPIEMQKAYLDKSKEFIHRTEASGFMKELLNPKHRITTCTAPIATEGMENIKVEIKQPDTDTIPTLKVDMAETEKDQKFKLFINKRTGIVSRRLSNGSILAYKQFENAGDWIYFEAFAKGGISLLGNDMYTISKYINDIAKLSKTDGFDLYERKEIGNTFHIGVERYINIEDRRITGKFHKDYFHEFMQMVCAYFKGSTPDNANFEKYRKAQLAILPYLNNSPERLLEELSNDIKFKNPSPQISDSLPLTQTDYEKALNVINMLFANAADFTFTFTGDVNSNKLMKYAEEAISSLGQKKSGLGKNENDTFYIARYDSFETIEVPMEHPRSINSYKITIPSSFSMEERICSRIAARFIERDIIREFANLGVIVKTSSRFHRYPKEAMTLEFRFTIPDSVHIHIDNLFSETIRNLSNRKIGNEELEIIRRNIELKDTYSSLTNPSYWSRVLRNRYINRKDFYSRMNSVLDAVTAADIENTLKKYNEEGVFSLISVTPEK